MRTRITEEQVHAVYDLGKQVFAGEIEASDAIASLTSEHGMNDASAQAYVYTLQHMLVGREYRRTANTYATRYFLERIHRDFGVSGLRRAIEAVKKHAAYYSGTGNSSQATLAILDEFAGLVGPKLTSEAYEAAFEAEVKDALAIDPEARARRLRDAPKVPQLVECTTRIFIRNPDVVAEVLLRADGVCERCRRDAPFKRAKDGMPYLEVHHKVPLADDGEDTVDNALALCPNCHRELHYGQEAAQRPLPRH